MHFHKKALKKLIDEEQKRVLLLTINHDDQVVINGDNLSCANLESSDRLISVLKKALKSIPEKDDDSYNFDDRIYFHEDPKAEFPKLFAKIGGKKWKKAEADKALSGYMKILGFGINAPKTYGKPENKPDWWPKKPKWSKFWLFEMVSPE